MNDNYPIRRSVPPVLSDKEIYNATQMEWNSSHLRVAEAQCNANAVWCKMEIEKAQQKIAREIFNAAEREGQGINWPTLRRPITQSPEYFLIEQTKWRNLKKKFLEGGSR